MTASAAPRRGSRGGRRRLAPVLLDISLAVGLCIAGFRYGAAWLQAVEARAVVTVLHAVGVDPVSGVLPRHILIFGADGSTIVAEVTASCSAILSVLGLAALTLTVLRGRRQHAVAGLVVATAVLLALNHVRLVASTVAGLWWGDAALVLFHDWVGTVWSLASTLGGFLLMVCITLPSAERAEQDVAGRHTARRPDSWARPGLGYRAADEDEHRRAVRRRTLTGLVHRYVLPRKVSRWQAARREARRIDYRIGHLPADQRAVRVRELAADGLGVHTASLLAVATYERDLRVLDDLADAVAARQWEPVTGPAVRALRLWARGWLLARPSAPRPTSPSAPPPVPRPRSFALTPPAPGARPDTPEDSR